jgi:hypothetical protein
MWAWIGKWQPGGLAKALNELLGAIDRQGRLALAPTHRKRPNRFEEFLRASKTLIEKFSPSKIV